MAELWQGKPIHIIGLGVGSQAGPQLNDRAVNVISEAQWVIGAEHQLSKIEHLATQAKKLNYPSPFTSLKDWLIHHQSETIVLLGSGDPLFYGLGAWLTKTLGADNLVFHTNVSSFQAACAQIGLPHQDVETISLHGRPLESIRSRLRLNQFFTILTDQYSHPAAIENELISAGFDQSKLWVCQDLGGENQAIHSFEVNDPALMNFEFHPLHVTIIQCLSSNPNQLTPEFPGLPDDAFETGKAPGKGLITKREVRLAALSYLSPKSGEIAWDIGTGCGSVAIEWARWNRTGHVFAIEHHPERLKYCRLNQQKFGVISNMKVVEGYAPDACHNLPDPDAVFIGGSGGRLIDILELSFQRLKEHGRVVITAVTESTKSELYQALENIPDNAEVEWSQVSVSKGDEIAGQLLLRPQLPVLIAQIRKLATSTSAQSIAGVKDS
ncbi:precorrin-6y C5,15-methyltransferase (decarboxylating) subunit CbiE [Litoribacillus peritrichatus]|uniref:Bifunctional cobalt-precorrin-7 (C(5))-methyltransferase/cobalt-precorrin-6B (C(15))-methyltransferase n=1 Tax=Litoribacillus peritrichatus TaxID=718191 RepID=A0ABP7MFF8_9GAMM